MEARHKKSGERDRQPEEWLAATLVELADTLIDEFDMVDFLSMLAQRCVELFGVDSGRATALIPTAVAENVWASRVQEPGKKPRTDCYFARSAA